MTTESPSYSTIEQAFSLGNGQDSALNWLRKNRSQDKFLLGWLGRTLKESAL